MSIELPKLTDEEVSAMFQYWHNERGTSWADLIRRVEKVSFEKASSHIEQARQEAARLALEEAAKAVSEIEEPAWYGYENPNTFTDAIHKAKDAIRALAAAPPAAASAKEGSHD